MKEYYIQIWTLASVLLGGIVTYVSTSLSDERKNKLQFRREKMEHSLIPCCTCVEETIKKMEKIEDSYFNSEQDLKKWLEILFEPLKYLNASKYFYLSESTRKLLENYRDKVKEFDDILKRESIRCFDEYICYLKKELKHFFNCKEIFTNTTLYVKFYQAILNEKFEFSLKDELVRFIIRDDNGNEIDYNIIEDYRKHKSKATNVFDSDKDRNEDEKINAKGEDENIEDEEMVLMLFEFIDNNDLESKSNERVKRINTESSSNLKKLILLLTAVKNNLTKEIKQITD